MSYERVPPGWILGGKFSCCEECGEVLGGIFKSFLLLVCLGKTDRKIANKIPLHAPLKMSNFHHQELLGPLSRKNVGSFP